MAFSSLWDTSRQNKNIFCKSIHFADFQRWEAFAKKSGIMTNDKGKDAGMNKVTTRKYETARYLDCKEMIAEYLSACLEDPNLDVFLGALGEVAKARGVAQLAKETGLSRESLYKTFSPGTKPRFETILKITNALGVPLGFRQS